MVSLRPLFIATAILAFPLAAGDDLASRRTIATEGESVVKVAPDEVSIRLEVSNLNQDLVTGRKAHALRVQSVIQSMRNAGIAADDLQTDYIRIDSEFEHSSKLLSGPEKKFVGYRLRTDLTVLLRDLAKFETVLQASLTSGADSVHGIQFRTSQLRKHRDAARAAALRAAREKAIAMASELGQKVGAPRTIREVSNGGSSFGRFQGANQNSFLLDGIGTTEGAGGLAPGLISIQANVSVVFDLE